MRECNECGGYGRHEDWCDKTRYADFEKRAQAMNERLDAIEYDLRHFPTLDPDGFY